MHESKEILPIKNITEEIPGITVELYSKSGTLLPVTPGNGRVFSQLSLGQSTFYLNVVVKEGECIVFKRSYAKSSNWKIEECQPHAETPEGLMFAQVVEVERRTNEQASADYPNNSIRMFHIENDGNIRLIIFSVICQDNSMFLVKHVTWEGCVHEWNNGFVITPAIGDNSAEKFFKGMIMQRELWKKEGFVKPEDEIPETRRLIKPKAGEMRVKYFNLANGTGVGVLQNDNEVKIHVSQILGSYYGLKFLYPGKIVGIKGTAPVEDSDSKFKRQAVGIDHRYKREERSLENIPEHIRNLIGLKQRV